MTFRGFLKSLMPPFVIDGLHAGRPLPSWQAATAAAASYAEDRLNSFKVERAALRPADGSLLAANVLYLTAMALGKTELTVTDFGGSTGDLGVDFLTVFPQATYTVVENPTMVALMQSSRGGVRFATTSPAECDIFFTSGTLQYIEDPMAVLAVGLLSARRAAVLVRNSFCDTDLFRAQKSWLFDNGNGPIPAGYKNVRVSYPHRTINENAVLECAKKHGFRCVARVEEQSGVVPYRGMVYGRQLVFLRAT